MRKLLGILSLVGMTTALLALGVQPAAADAATDSVVAAITGGTTVTPPPLPGEPPSDPGCNALGPFPGSFTGVALTGVFTADAVAFGGVVEIEGGSVSFCATENALSGRGYLKAATFKGSTGGTTVCIEGGITGGKFVRVGTVALARLGVNYEVDLGCNESIEGVASTIETLAVVKAVPLVDCLDLGCAAVAGVVGGSRSKNFLAPTFDDEVFNPLFDELPKP